MMDPSANLMVLRQNLGKVQDEIRSACIRAGRPPESVQLLAVTKYVAASVVRLLYEAGCRNFGENRADALQSKAEQLSELPIRWHFIGHLQRNKIKWILPHVALVHSVDRISLLETLNQLACQQGRPIPILLEVNLSGEPSKGGFRLEEAMDAATRVRDLPGLQLKGLMGMSGLESAPPQKLREFQLLANLQRELMPWATEKDPLSELSMGMSDDFELAIQAGSTIVRIGSRLFEGLSENH